MEEKKQQLTENFFENKTLYNNQLVEIFNKTLEFNNSLLKLLNEHKKVLEKAKENGSFTKR